MPLPFQRELDRLAGLGRTRALLPAAGLDFSSNDYLGLAAHPALGQAVAQALAEGLPVGSGGSRLLRGNHPAHQALETQAAAFFGTEAALYFNSGFDANLALFSTLPSRHDHVIHDQFIHASVKEGVRASLARRKAVPHNNVSAFAQAVEQARRKGAQQVFVAVESLYSMDGDRAPLADLVNLARDQDAVLVVDEAHATGVYGPGGRGLAHELDHGLGHGLDPERIICLHTCGKALGVSGGLVTGSRAMVDTLVNGARSFLFTTAASPLMARAVSCALELSAQADEARARLARLTALGRARLEGLTRWRLLPGDTHILPVVVGTDSAAVWAAERLRTGGFDVRAIRPPTVPEGTARLRVSLNTQRTPEEVEALARRILALEEEWAQDAGRNRNGEHL
ncbi:MAG: 8-amino-7-oxononanoate synthase [Deltaproteobacteria bacterium]|nr:8-amino-7-oxononanoate synthase [Deltaproteobacteria bacterium]